FRGVLGAPRLDGDGAILPACASQPLPQIPDGADVGALGLDAHEHLLAHWLGGRKVADLSRRAPSGDLHDAHRPFLGGPSTLPPPGAPSEERPRRGGRSPRAPPPCSARGPRASA